MLGLGEQVGSNMRRVAAAIVDHQNLTRPGDHVDIDRSEDQALGRGDVNIAGTGDLVDPGNRRRTVSQSSHGLGSANLERFDLLRRGERPPERKD